MKKYVIVTIVFSVFCLLSKAQQSQLAEAVLRPGGGQLLTITDASGKTTIIKGNTNEEIQAKYASLRATQPKVSATESSVQQEPAFVPHAAVLLKNGDQEIRWRDAAGNERIVTAKKGESIQAKYLAYLKKEGLPCGCTAAALPLAPGQSEVKTAIKP